MKNKIIMLFCLIAIVIVPYVSFCYALQGEEGKCVDSDGGNNYYQKGYVDAGGVIHYDQCGIREHITWGNLFDKDSCKDETGCVLMELSCPSPSASSWASTDYNCPNGCKEGACILQEPEPVSECPTGCICEGNIIKCPTEDELCTDSDGGKNYDAKGTAKDSFGTERTDVCQINLPTNTPTGVLFEAFCDDESSAQTIVNYVQYSCPNGCKEGACIEGSTVCPTNQKVAVNNIRNSDGKIAVDYTIGPETNAVEIWFGLASGADLRKCELGPTGACSIAKGQSYTSCSVVTECIYPTDNREYMVTIHDRKCGVSDTHTFSGTVDNNIYVYLGKKFDLSQGQTAIVKDYKNMKIRYIAESTCACIEGQECPPCEKEILLQVEMPEDCKKNSGNVVEECTTQATEFTIKVGEIKRVFGAEIKLVNLYNSIATLLVTKETSPPQGIYVKLGEKFTLAEGDSAKVTDYNYMEIRLNKIFGNKVSVQVEIPSVCEEAACTSGTGTGTEFNLNQGESKEVFGVKLTFLGLAMNIGTGREYATFIVEKSSAEGGVDVEIIPSQQTISYGEKAVYKVMVTDKHAAPECPIGAQCKPTAPLIYKITVKNLPFLKEYPTEISVPYGGSTTLELIVKPYELIEPIVTEKKPAIAITGKTIETSTVKKVISKPVKRIEKIEIAEQIGTGTIVSTSAEISKEDTSIEPVQIALPSNLIKKYKFSVTATLKDNSKIQDTANAVLLIKPLSPTPPPPEFPGEKVSIKLYKGWNLISLPGKLIKFDKEGLMVNQKLIGFVYIKEKQKYFSLKEAEEILGDELKDYLAKNAFWIYSKAPMALNVWVDREISFEDLELVKGWNLVPITEDMLGGYLADIIGDCELDKIYLWDAKSQEWVKIDLKYSFSDYQLGYGFLVKSRNYCRLIGPEIITPPSMPE